MLTYCCSCLSHTHWQSVLIFQVHLPFPKLYIKGLKSLEFTVWLKWKNKARLYKTDLFVFLTPKYNGTRMTNHMAHIYNFMPINKLACPASL